MLASCGDDGGSAQADANSEVNDGAPIDAPVGAIDADRTLTDADLNMPDAAPPSEVIINEILLDQSGPDKDEFVELKGLANTDYSGLTVLQVDGDQDNNVTLNPGLVISNHAGCTTDANGYCQITVNNNSFQNGSQTMLLVMGGTYVNGTTDVDANNDGSIDTEPWAVLLDGVAIVNNATDYAYAGNTVLMKTVAGNQDDPVTFGGASRIPDGTDTDATSDWTSNTPNFDNGGIASGEARNTPAAVNSVEP